MDLIEELSRLAVKNMCPKSQSTCNPVAMHVEWQERIISYHRLSAMAFNLAL